VDTVRSYRDLVAWQRAIDLVEACYRLSRTFPRDELFGLTSQLRRAAVSVAANIAEGYGRQTLPAYIGFLRIAQGSLKEVETHLIIAGRVGIASDADLSPILSLCDEQGRLTRALINALGRSREPS
jgi:four helix bundle protein